MSPISQCLFCLNHQVLAKLSDSDWDVKIKHVGQPFFTSFNLHCDYWESFKKANFCSECFGRLEELRFLLRKIEATQSDVIQLKKAIGSTVKTSANQVSEFTPTRDKADPLFGIHELRQQLSAQQGFEFSPSSPSVVGFLNHNNSTYTNGSSYLPVKSVIVCQGNIRRGAEAVLNLNGTGKPRARAISLNRSTKRRRSSISPSLLRCGFNSKNPKLDIDIQVALPNSVVTVSPNAMVSNEVRGSPDLAQSIIYTPEVLGSDEESQTSRHPVNDQLPNSISAGLEEEEVNMTPDSVESPSSNSNSGHFSQVENKVQSQELEEHEDNHVSSTYTIHREQAEAEDNALSPRKLTYSVTGKKTADDEVSPFRSTYKVQDSNSYSNKTSNDGSEEMWKSHQGLAPSEIGTSEAENTFSDPSKSIGNHSTVNGENIFCTQENVVSKCNDVAVPIVTPAEGQDKVDANADSGSDVYYDSSEVMYETHQGGRDQLDASAPNLCSDSEVTDERKTNVKRKRRPRKRKRLYDAPESMFICVSKGCRAMWNSEELLQQHIENDHNGELEQNDCELCLLKKPKPLVSSTPAVNNQIQMCHDAENCAFKCDICSDTFLNSNCKEYHQSRHRPRGETTFTRCSECDKTFNTPACLRNHLNLHSLKLNCGSCLETFTSLLDLRMHNDIDHAVSIIEKRKIHQQRKQKQRKSVVEFECTNCSEKFRNNESLQRHLPSHVPNATSDKKAFQCPNCPKTFELEKYVVYHKQYCLKRNRKKRL